MPVISGKALERLEAHLATLLDEDTLRRRGGRPIPPSVLALQPWDDFSGQPGQHRLHIAREPMQERSSGGIIIPMTVREQSPMTMGWIIAASPACNSGNPEVLLGTKVVFGKYAGGSFLLVEGESDMNFGPFVSLREGEIWADDPSEPTFTYQKL